MALPLAALALQSGVSLLGSHILRAQAVETAFNIGGQALSRLLPSQGRDMGLSEFYAPTLSTLSALASATVSNRDLGRLLGKAEVVAELARDVLNSPASLAMSDPMRRALSAIEIAATSFSSTQSSLGLFSAAQQIRLPELQGDESSSMSMVLDAFSSLLDSVSHFTGQSADALAQAGPAGPGARS